MIMDDREVLGGSLKESSLYNQTTRSALWPINPGYLRYKNARRQAPLSLLMKANELVNPRPNRWHAM